MIPFFLDSTLFMIFSLMMCRGQGMGIMIMTHLCCSFLLREGLLLLLQHGVPSTRGSHSWAAQMWVVAMGCSSLSQQGFVTGSPISPAQLFQCEVLSPRVLWVQRSCQAAPVWAAHSVTPPSRMSTSLPLWAEGGSLLHHDLRRLQDMAASPWSHKLCSSSTSCRTFADCEYVCHMFLLLYPGYTCTTGCYFPPWRTATTNNGLSLGQVLLRTGWHWPWPTWRQPLASCPRNSPRASLLPSPCYAIKFT